MSKNIKRVLALDPGVNSIGWVLTEQNLKGELTKFIDGGSRIFQSVKDSNTGVFKNEHRRNKRLIRRNKCRSNRRMSKLENYLIRNNLLSQKIIDFNNNSGLIQQIVGNPYNLRKKGLDEQLTSEELGWAIMHLAKRRGFLSSSKSFTDEEKKDQARADELALKIKESNCRTLGEYFSNLYEKNEKIRGVKLKRQLIQDELALILDNQKENNSIITENFIKDLNSIIFNQRPLKIQKRISLCKFESFGNIKKYTAAKYHPLSQQFIIWNFINNLKYNNNDSNVKDLTIEQKNIVFKLLWENKEITYKKVIKELDLDTNVQFNFQENEKDKIKGNQLLNYFNKSSLIWFNNLTENDKFDLIQDLSTINDLTGIALKKRLYNRWTKNEDLIENLILVSTKLPQGYTSLCVKSIRKILPFLKEGYKYYEAEKLAYPNFFKSNMKVSKLPKIEGISNGVVLKSCTQVRLLVNKIIDTYGDIDVIKIELARDLSKSSKQLSKIKLEQSKNKNLNTKAIEGIENFNNKNETKIDLSKENILKYKLWADGTDKDGIHVSCYPILENGIWSFKTISLDDLFNSNSDFEIEHIIPKSISGDDSYSNKALCHHKINKEKGNRTPYDYYFQKGGQDIINLISKKVYKDFGKFKGGKFLISTQDYLNENQIQTRFLNDTSYVALFLKDYLQQVCKEQIIVSKGGFTSMIRSSLNLNKILGNEKIKNRLDHRHHMVDAFCISLISPNVLNILEKMRKEVNKKTQIYIDNEEKLKLHTSKVYSDFIKHFNEVITSHEVEMKVKGEIEEETLYGYEEIVRKDGCKIGKLFVHKSYEFVVEKKNKKKENNENNDNTIIDENNNSSKNKKTKEYKSAKELLDEHNNNIIKLPKGLKKYLEKYDKLPDIYSGWKRIKCYYQISGIKDCNGNILGYRTVFDKNKNIIGYKKAVSKAYAVVNSDYSVELISKLNELRNRPKFDNILFKLYRGDLLQSPEGIVFKIYNFIERNNYFSIHPVNEIAIESRSTKKYEYSIYNKETKFMEYKEPNKNCLSKSIGNFIKKEKYNKIMVNIIGKII